MQRRRQPNKPSPLPIEIKIIQGRVNPQIISTGRKKGKEEHPNSLLTPTQLQTIIFKKLQKINSIYSLSIINRRSPIL